MPEQHLGGLVGVAHAAVPVEPEDADGAVIETELGQSLCFLGRLAQLDVAACGLQPTFQQAMLTSLPGQHQQAGQQQYAQQQGQASPVPDLAPEVVDSARRVLAQVPLDTYACWRALAPVLVALREAGNMPAEAVWFLQAEDIAPDANPDMVHNCLSYHDKKEKREAAEAAE